MDEQRPTASPARQRWHHTSFIAGALSPLVLSSFYTYFVMRSLRTEPVSPLYPVVLGLGLGLPPLFLVGGLASTLLRRPRDPRARFALAFVLGGALWFLGQRGAFHF